MLWMYKSSYYYIKYKEVQSCMQFVTHTDRNRELHPDYSVIVGCLLVIGMNDNQRTLNYSQHHVGCVRFASPALTLSQKIDKLLCFYKDSAEKREEGIRLVAALYQIIGLTCHYSTECASLESNGSKHVLGFRFRGLHLITWDLVEEEAKLGLNL